MFSCSEILFLHLKNGVIAFVSFSSIMSVNHPAWDIMMTDVLPAHSEFMQ